MAFLEADRPVRGIERQTWRV